MPLPGIGNVDSAELAAPNPRYDFVAAHSQQLGDLWGSEIVHCWLNRGDWPAAGHDAAGFKVKNLGTV
jgi:hypothetical protein